MRRWRLPARLARREVLRRPGRTALVALLVAVPVCGMTAASVLFRTGDLSPARQFELEYGGAHAVLLASEGNGAAAGTPPDAFAGVPLPERAETADMRTAPVRVQGPGPARRHATVFDLAPPAFDGDPLRVRLVAGRAAGTAEEAAVTEAVLRSTGAAVGDRLTISAAPFTTGAAEPPPPRDVEIVGVVENGRCLSCRHVLVQPGAPLPVADEAVTLARAVTFPDAGPTPAEAVAIAGALAQAGLPSVVHPDLVARAASLVDPSLAALAGSFPGAGDDDAGGRVRWAVVLGTVALTAAGIVISAAFAVGARRQLTTLGQLSATGATPQVLRWSLALQGSLSGLVGTAVGLAAGLLLPALARGTIERRFLDHRLPAWDLRVTELAVIAGVGVLAATVAALLPARTAAKVPTLAALAGRRPLAPVPARLPLGGLVAIAAGLGLLALAVLGARSGQSSDAWALTAIVGGVVQLFGACAVAPALVARLEPLAARLRGSWRLGARSLARQRTRTGAVVAAVAVVGALAVFGGGMVRGLDARQDDGFGPPPLPDDVALLSVERSEVVPPDPGPPLVAEPLAVAPDGPWPPICATRPCGVSDDGSTVVRLPDACRDQMCHIDADGAVTAWPEVCGRLPMCSIEPDGTVTTPHLAAPGPVVVDQARAVLGGVPAVEVRAASPADGTAVPIATVATPDGPLAGPGMSPGQWPTHTVDRVAVADPSVLDVLDAPSEVRTILAGDGAVVIESFTWMSSTGPGGPVGAASYRIDWPARPGTDVAGVVRDQAGSLGALRHSLATLVLVAPDALDDLGLVPAEPVAVLLRADRALGDTQREALADLYDLAETDEGYLSVSVHVPDPGPSPIQLQLLLAGLALVAAVLVIGTSLALAAAETRDEREVLAVAGARPGTLARAAGAKAVVLAGLGGVMAVPLGLLPVGVVAASLSTSMPVLPPWPTIGLLAVAVPLLAGLAATAASAAAQRLRPVRVSTATFE